MSYLAWGWWVLGNTSTPCSSARRPRRQLRARSRTMTGTAVSPDGTSLHIAPCCFWRGTRLQITTMSLPDGTRESAVFGHLGRRRRQPPLQMVDRRWPPTVRPSSAALGCRYREGPRCKRNIHLHRPRSSTTGPRPNPTRRRRAPDRCGSPWDDRARFWRDAQGRAVSDGRGGDRSGCPVACS